MGHTIITKWGFKSKTQSPLFMIWREQYDENGGLVFAWVVFNSRRWIGI